MARAIWTGSISFGLVTIPVQMLTAVEEQRVSFHLLSKDGRCRLRRKLYCPDTGEEYDYENTSRGYEIAPERYVVFDPEELDNLRPDSGRTIEIKQFADLESIDPIYYDRPYYLVPGKDGARPYHLLVQALASSNRVALAQFVMREHEYLATLRVRDGVIVLETMHYGSEIKAVTEEELPPPQNLDKKELNLALQLIESLVEPFDAARFKNSYQAKLQELIEKKSRGQQITRTPSERTQGANIINLMDALKASIARRKKQAAPRAEKPSKSGRPSPRPKKRRAANT